MKSIFLIIGFLFISLLTPDLSDVREAYRNAANTREKAEKLYQKLNSITETDGNLLLAYKGAASTIMAKYAKGVKVKTAYFKEGKRLIEQAIEATPESVELRYIRLSVQENAPKIVRYKQHIAQDKQFILDNFKTIQEAETKQYVKGFVSQSTSFSEAEKQLF